MITLGGTPKIGCRLCRPESGGRPPFVAVQVKGEIDFSNTGQVTGLADGLHDSTVIVSA